MENETYISEETLRLPEVASVLEFYRNATTKELVNRADTVCRTNVGDTVWLRGLIEISNHCKLDCLYCGIRRSNREVERYRLDDEDIVATALEAHNLGLRSLVLQGGEDGQFKADHLARIIDKIKTATHYDTAITLSCGSYTKAEYKILKDAGADRYLMRFETSDPKLHEYIRNGLTLNQRLNDLYNLKDVGFETGSGYMVGLPGETEEIRINNSLLCKQLELDMVGIGCFIPHPSTPLGNAPQEPIELTIRSVALTRLLLPKANMPATTAVGSLDKTGREKVMRAGANVLMPNITPVSVKKNYLLYPGKICLDESGLECIQCLKIRTKAVDKVVGTARGDSLHYRERTNAKL